MATPLTDAALQQAWDFQTFWVSPTIARELEEKLNAANTKLDAYGKMETAARDLAACLGDSKRECNIFQLLTALQQTLDTLNAQNQTQPEEGCLSQIN